MAPLLPRSGLVLYGSETGNAQDVAEELGRMLERIHFSTEVMPLNSVEPVRRAQLAASIFAD
jgi:sulfite reductase alpha subunit-like flavoprotein